MGEVARDDPSLGCSPALMLFFDSLPSAHIEEVSDDGNAA